MWGQLSQAEQMEAMAAGTPVDILFFPVWPFFLVPSFCIPFLGITLFWNTLFVDHSATKIQKRLAVVFALVCGIGLCAFAMKFDHAVWMAQYTGLLCALPIIIALGFCSCMSIQTQVPGLTIYSAVACGLLFSLSIPITFVSLWVLSVDEQLDVGVWVYLTILSIFLCIFTAFGSFAIYAGNWGSS